jgi:hypothetical protein
MYPIKIRANGENGPELTYTEAVQVAMGNDPRVNVIYVTAVYAEDTDGGRDYAGRSVTHDAGRAVFGLDTEIRVRDTAYGEARDAMVSISGLASHSPEVGQVRVQCYALAVQIAAAANAAAAVINTAAEEEEMAGNIAAAAGRRNA